MHGKYQLKGTAGPVVNQKIPLAEAVALPEGSGARIELSAEGVLRLVVEASRSQPVRVNGVEVERAALSAGDEIQVGPNRWVVQAPGLRPEKVLTEEAVAPQRPVWPWWLAAALLAGGAYAAWHFGLIDRFLA